MRVQQRVDVAVDRSRVWDVVSDPDCYPDFMPQLARWENATEGPAGVGSRYTAHWTIGSVPVGGLVEIVEFDNLRDLAWVGITGLTVRGRFRLRDAGDGRTRVTFRLSYQAPGGLLGLIADRVAARQVSRALCETLESLKKLVDAR